MNQQTVFNLLLCLFLLASCSEKNEIPKLEKGLAIITGTIKNIGENTKTIRIAAGGVVEDIVQTALIDSEGNFNIEVELYHPQNVQVFCNGELIKLYLNPSDSVHLEIDEALFEKDNLPNFKILGTSPSAKISREIQLYFQKVGEGSFDYPIEHLSVTSFLQLLNKEINRIDSVSQVFSKKHKTSKDFQKWVKRNITYRFANKLLNYKFSHQNYEGDLFDTAIFPVNDATAIISSYYPLHLRHYALNTGIWQDTITQNLLKQNKNAAAYQRCINTIMNTVEKGLSRDIMCYKVLLPLFKESYDAYKKVAHKIDTYIEDETLKSILAEKESAYLKQKKNDISFLDPKTNEEKELSNDFWNELKVKYEGKVIYVDIWATWCGPCRAEIPNAIELHEHFKEQDIAFVNLCLASNKDDWEKMLQNNPIKGDNYFFNNVQTELLRDKLKFNGYPTYLIIDKQGNLVNKDAPRPSSNEKIKKLLSEWIEKDILSDKKNL